MQTVLIALSALALVTTSVAAQLPSEVKAEQAKRAGKGDVIVYVIEGSTIYHGKDCVSLQNQKVRAVKVADLPLTAAECGTCKPLTPAPDWLNPRPTTSPTTAQTGLCCWLVTEHTVSRADPNEMAKVVDTYEPYELLMIREAVPGWFRLWPTLMKQESRREWIEASNQENLIPERKWLTAKVRIMEVTKQRWSQAIKLDVMRQRVRVGFTPEHVRLALGQPLRQVKEETASGTVDSWFYRDRVLTFTNGLVSKIVTEK